MKLLLCVRQGGGDGMVWARFAACALAAVLTLLAVGLGFHFAIPVVAPGIPPQFLNAALFRPWAGWTRIYMLLHPVWFGVVFASVYLLLQGRGAVAGGWEGGLEYGLGVFLVGALPVWALAYAVFSVSPEVMASFVIQSVCQYLAAGAAVGAARALV
jgi:hypothetical protein